MTLQDREYVNYDLLVDTQWLAERLTRADIRVVDMGPFSAYHKAHIPGAVHVGPGDRSHYLKDADEPLHVMAPDAFEELMGSLGIGRQTLVVAYDADGGLMAARLWWTLSYYGHDSCKLLDGGWNKWLHEKRPASMEVQVYRRATFSARIRETVLCTLEDLGERIGKDNVTFIDVRSEDEWTGANDRGNQRTGHLPGAVHFPWQEAVSDDGLMTLRPAAEIRKRLQEHGVSPHKPAITY
ncbi:MAG: sulfurtransferase [Chloroflexi bacterium]|nr:sulfurtransferase [Chloroflexota bacterium]